MLQKILRDYFCQDAFRQTLINNLQTLPLTAPISDLEEVFIPQNFRQLSLYPFLFLAFIYYIYPPACWNDDVLCDVDNLIECIAEKDKTVTGLETQKTRFLTLSQQEQFNWLCYVETSLLGAYSDQVSEFFNKSINNAKNG